MVVITVMVVGATVVALNVMVVAAVVASAVSYQPLSASQESS